MIWPLCPACLLEPDESGYCNCCGRVIAAHKPFDNDRRPQPPGKDAAPGGKEATV